MNDITVNRVPTKCSSQRVHTAVNEQQDAGDGGGIVGGQKQDRGSDLLSPARAACPALALYCSTVNTVRV